MGGRDRKIPGVRQPASQQSSIVGEFQANEEPCYKEGGWFY